MTRLAVLVFMPVLALNAQEYTRGIGVYPGDPKEDFGPVMKPESSYRNLALHRPAWHSSAYDYNLTAQLVTDGIKDTAMPRWVSTSTSQQGVLPRNEREWPLDSNWVSSVRLKGSTGWVQVELGGGDQPLEIDSIQVDAAVASDPGPENWTVTISGSGDGQSWTATGAGLRHGPSGRRDQSPYPFCRWRNVSLLPRRIRGSTCAWLLARDHVLLQWRAGSPRRRPMEFHQRMDAGRQGRRVGLCRSRRDVHVRPRRSVLDTPRRRRLDPGFRRCGELDHRSAALRRATTSSSARW